MNTLTFVLLLLAGSVAVVAHARVQPFGAACLIAACCAAPPSLVIFDLGGGSKTDFVPFNLFVLFWMDLIVSALVGVPFWWRRNGQPVTKSALPFGEPSGNAPSLSALQQQSWSLQAGIATTLLFALLLNRLVFFALSPSQFAAPTIPLKFILIILFVATIAVLLSGAMLHLLFQTGLRLAGHHSPLPAKHEFWVGFSLSATLLLLFVLTANLVPPVWNQGVHRLTFALDVNWFCFMPVILGRLYAKRIS